jgi:glycine dehydrogenase subunit 1
MRYIPVTCEQREAMLRAVGCDDTTELFADVPENIRLKDELAVPGPLTEIELSTRLHGLAEKNVPASSLISFAGAGYYDHYIPSVVDHVVSKPEFFTAYTPYQPEVSQGTLQAIYEYQSMICSLTGMDVANASMYDGATALVEGALMACRLTKRDKLVVAGMIHPEWVEVLETYASSGLMEIVANAPDARTDVDELADVIDDSVAAVLIASPNFVGVLEDLQAVADVAHAAGALLVVATNPVLLGVMEPPASFGADIVVGEGQPLGNTMSFGGPGLGFFACRDEHVRQMPGRLVGRTVDVDGAGAFVLTLSTREQHIRREKATSNICSNHALNALAAGAYLSAVGTEGLSGIARVCVARAHYLRDRLLDTGRFSSPWEHPFGYEFALVYEGDTQRYYEELFAHGFVPGVVLETGSDEPDLVLFSVTEKRTREQIDSFVEAVRSL